MDIMTACGTGRCQYVKEYIEKNENIDVRDERGWSPIIMASRSEYADIVRMLIDAGANVNAKDNDGRTPIMFASLFGNFEVARLLVDSGCDINARDKDGWTALMSASVRNHENIVRLLVGAVENVPQGTHSLCVEDARGMYFLCDINAKYEGKNALLLALERGNSSLGSFLAQTMILRLEIPYSDIPISWFVPQRNNMSVGKYVQYKANIALLCMDRATRDPEFQYAMQKDIVEILGKKTTVCRYQFTEKDQTFCKNLLHTLRSIDYTDRVSITTTSAKPIRISDADGRIKQEDNEENILSVYDVNYPPLNSFGYCHSLGV